MARRKANRLGARRAADGPGVKTSAPQASGDKLAARANFDLPAQPLGTALKQFADQAGIQILLEDEVVGGLRAPAIKALGGPFPQVSFCPTGGISTKNLSSYLSLPNVIAVGGSWMVPSDLNEADAFSRAASLAREARVLAVS